ncbi:MAG TPA: hypothetical protein VGN16_10980 [Acidobacteriaceae bacterium]|jgi:hypothetical protein
MTAKEDFDTAMRQVLTVSKEELNRRIENDRQRREENPQTARIESAQKRPKHA